MRIVHVARGRDWRGGERQVLRLMQALTREAEVDQLLVTATDCALARAAGDAGLPVHGTTWRAGVDPRPLAALHRLLRRSAAPVVLHAHDSHALLLASLAARWHGLPVVATRRSMTRPGAHGPWVRADRVIAISAAVAATLRAAGVPAARICVIPSTVSLPELAEAADTGPREGPIVAVGALTREKGHDVLLDAMALLLRHRPTTRLVIAGTGPLRAALQQQAGALGIAGQVELRGSVADIPSLLRQGAVLAHPSRREALGTAVLEAMAHGLPVVASETGGLGELLQDGAGLLVPPESPEALAVALLTVLTQPETARALAATARERVAAYAGDGMTGRVMQVYRSLCVAP